MESTPPDFTSPIRARHRNDFSLGFVLQTLLVGKWVTKEQANEVSTKESSIRAKIARDNSLKGMRYEVSPIEIICDFRFPLPGKPGLFLDEDKICEICASQIPARYKKVDPLTLDMTLVTRTFSRPYALRHAVLPLEKKAGSLWVAVSNPFDQELFDNLRTLVGLPIEIVLSSKSEIIKALEHVYGFKRSVAAAAHEHQGSKTNLSSFEQLVRLSTRGELDANDKPIVAAVEYLLRYAFNQRASDIHIEPKRNETLVRMRIDGILHSVHTVPVNVHSPIIARIKTLARMDIAEKRRCQDGRIKTDRDGREIELRISTIPTAFGEKAVLRIFDPEILVQDLTQLGFMPEELSLFETWISRPHGLILVTGPTGSGKTTTIYSALRMLAGPDVNVTTIEDPIEMIDDNFNQIQVQPKIDLDFSEAMRHILRQDPDIIMVGEIRDPETAKHAIQAALTGHLVLSTLHTNNACDAVMRLIDLGVERFLLISSLIGVMAQRLVRVNCPHCSQSFTPATDQVAAIKVCLPLLPDGTHFQKGTGCPQCRNTGYLGRTGIFELLDANEKIKNLVLSQADSSELMANARKLGMRTLRESGALKAVMGITTLEEILRTS